jgi:hypothetical protein
MTDTIGDTISDLDRDALYKLFEKSPGDLAAYGGMADRLDELGYASLAHAYRWMWKRGKWPHKRERYATPGGRVPGRSVPAPFRWGWYSEKTGGSTIRDVYPSVPREPHGLPRVLLFAPHKYYPSHAAAVMDLATWLQRLKSTHDLEPPRKEL